MTDKIEAREKVYEILKGFSTAMFVTIGLSGRPAGRPMHIARVEEDLASISFLTSKGGAIVEEVAEEAVVLLIFQNENSAYLAIRGRARLVQDRQRIKELWKEPYKVWFPDGPEDPEIGLLSVSTVDAEYWDNRGMNKLEYLFEAAKAYVTGEKPNASSPDQHAKTNL